MPICVTNEYLEKMLLHEDLHIRAMASELLRARKHILALQLELNRSK